MLISLGLLRLDDIYRHMVVVIQIKFPVFNVFSQCIFSSYRKRTGKWGHTSRDLGFLSPSPHSAPQLSSFPVLK